MQVAESRRSKIVKFVMRNTVRKQLKTQKLNLKLLRLLDKPEPPSRYFKNCTIERKEINGSIVHIIEPNNSTSDNLLFYIHGGAFISGPMRVHWRLLSKIVHKTGYKVALVNYPKLPNNDYKVIQGSVQAVYKYLIERFDVTKMYMGGDSAGGGLTLTTALWAKKSGLPLPKKLLPLCPVTEMTLQNEEVWAVADIDPFLAVDGLATVGKWYVNGDNPMLPEISAIYADLTGLPPMDIFCGTNDMLYPDGKRFAEKAKSCGVNVKLHEYPKMMHTWMFFPIPEAKKAFSQIVTALQ